jgi:glycosylphosphatidylinositol transamidase (GPIT) subunit GPI8
MRDDIAYHPKNPHQGVIKVSPDGENLYQDVVLDYRADTLTTKDIEDILQGNKSGRLSTVLESTDTDNVLLYWTGHGAEKSFSWLEKGEKFTDQQLGATVRKLYDDKKYKSMLICAEPCYSGSVVCAIEGVPLVLGFSAASDSESSYADNFSSELGVWMCDRFSFNLIRIYEEFNYISLLDTFKKLNASTLASHVQVFNTENFYSLGDAMLWSYFYNFGNY